MRKTKSSHSKLDNIFCQLLLPVLSWKVLPQAPDRLDLLLVARDFDVLVKLVLQEVVPLCFRGTYPNLHEEFDIVVAIHR